MRDRDAIYQDILALARACVADASLRSDTARREASAVHVKLIPGLLRCGDERRHRGYLVQDRPRFVRACRNDAHAGFAPLWAELEAIAWPDGMPAGPAGEPPLAKYAGPVGLGYAGPRA